MNQRARIFAKLNESALTREFNSVRHNLCMSVVYVPNTYDCMHFNMEVDHLSMFYALSCYRAAAYLSPPATTSTLVFLGRMSAPSDAITSIAWSSIKTSIGQFITALLMTLNLQQSDKRCKVIIVIVKVAKTPS